MPPRLSEKNLAPLTQTILDEISDGQWHPMNKLSKSFASKKDSHTIDELMESIESLVEKTYLIAGENTSFRMPDKYVRQWRNQRNLGLETKDSRSPRYFGGVLEDEGWTKAPLKPCELLHFRANSHVNTRVIQEHIGELGKASQDEDGLLRIITLHGSEIYVSLKAWGKENPELGITGVRLNPNAKRRDIDELPAGFMDDLCLFYGSFARVLLRKSMSSITKHIPEQEDIQQQIYLWIIDAVARYDEKTCIPFAAYLSAVLQKWVHNLNRKAHGRSAADNELKHARAIALFETTNGRTPTMVELAEGLGESVEKVQKDSISIRMVSNLRSMTTLDSDDFTVPLVAKETTTDEVEQELEKTLLSAALISTALEQAENTNNGSLFAFFAVIDKTWNKEKSLGFLYKDIPTTILNRHETSLMQEVGQKIRLAYAA